MWDLIYPDNGKKIQQWETVSDKQQMENIMVNWQRKHFQQVNETPLAHISWKDKFDSPHFQRAVLDGSYTPPLDLPPETREVLLHLKKRKEIKNEIPFRTTYSEFCSFIHNAKEVTASSPSGRSYSHYKALLQGPPYLLRTIHSLLELCLQHGIILKRWRKTVTTLIEKDEGRPKVHRMKAIHIIESEVQFIAKSFYILRMMKLAEKHKLISDEQYGGRNKHQAQSVILNKIMYYNISTQTRIPAAFMDDDARACYDRSLTSFNGLENRRWGMPFKMSEFTTKFIESQIYSIRTGSGVSNFTYKFERDAQIQGSGQGIAWAGPRWINSGDTCSRILRKNCAGMKFESPNKKLVIQRTGDFFVDDRANGTTENSINNTKTDLTLLQQFQRDEQIYAYTLFCANFILQTISATTLHSSINTCRLLSFQDKSKSVTLLKENLLPFVG